MLKSTPSLGKGEVQSSILCGSTIPLRQHHSQILMRPLVWPSVQMFQLAVARAIDDTILTRIVNDGTIRLDPPGLELATPDIYPGPPSSPGEL